jgi:hypothetical protein
MPAQLRLLALRLADGIADVAQQRKILIPEAPWRGKILNILNTSA